MTAFAWSAIATVFVFALSQIIKVIVSYIHRKEQEKALCKSLYSEVSMILSLIGVANSIESFEEFIKSHSVEEINACSFVALNSSIYKNIAKELPYLDADTVALVTKFYCLFDIFNGFIVHFKSKDFVDAGDDTQSLMKHYFIQNVRSLHEVGNDLQSRLRT